MRGKKPRAHQWTHVAMYGRTSNQIHSSIYITIAGIRPCGPVRGGGILSRHSRALLGQFASVACGRRYSQRDEAPRC